MVELKFIEKPGLPGAIAHQGLHQESLWFRDAWDWGWKESSEPVKG